MVCEEVLGNIKDLDGYNHEIDYVDIEWHEAFKKIHKKYTYSGTEIGIRLGNEVLKKGLRDGDILYKDNSRAIVVNIPSCEVIEVSIDENHGLMLGKVCYEIGNKHASLFWGDDYLKLVTPYNEPMLAMLEKMHGVKVEVNTRKLDFDKRLSASINAHTH